MHHYQYLGRVKRILTKSDKSIQEQTAAETKSIGFDYQYYYFLLIMIQLETGQSIGYEVPGTDKRQKCTLYV
jgi:hypothetical protein